MPHVYVCLLTWRRTQPLKGFNDAFLLLFKGVFNTHKIFLKFLHLLLVALQTAVVHGSALNRDLSNLQIHLLELETPIKFSVNKQTISHIILIQKQLNCLASLLSTGGSKRHRFRHPANQVMLGGAASLKPLVRLSSDNYDMCPCHMWANRRAQKGPADLHCPINMTWWDNLHATDIPPFGTCHGAFPQ